MLITKILEVEFFDVWGIDCMKDFVISYYHKYILVGVKYVSKLVEAIALEDNEGKIMVEFLRKNIFSHFGMPHTIISDGGFDFFNKVFWDSLVKYEVKQRLY